MIPGSGVSRMHSRSVEYWPMTATATATATAIAPERDFPVVVFPAPRRGRGHLRIGFGVLVAYLVIGNVGIFGASAWARHTTAVPPSAAPVGVANFQAVDDLLWRGAAPSWEGYRWLASQGVRTVVDLRAEDDIHVDAERLAALGLELVAIPMRDGQAPSAAQVDRFLDVMRSTRERVFVHCGAGVGRTGTMVASYLVETGQADGWSAVRRNLAVGPPSLEQLAYAVGLDGGHVRRPGPLVVALSRTLDAPRRVWVRIRS